DLPADLRWLHESGAVTLEQLASLHDQLGVTSLGDLTAAVAEQAVRSVPGCDETAERAVAAALGDIRRAVPRIPLGRAFGLAEPILAELRSIPEIEWALPAGSLRRAQDSVGDIELIAASTDPAEAIETIARSPHFDRVLHQSERQLYVLANRTQIGMRFPEPRNAGAMLLRLTGSTAHVAALRARAAARGWRLATAGLHDPDGAFHPA